MPQKQISVTIEVPEWANYVSQDYNSEIYFYDKDPIEKEMYWNCATNNGKTLILGWFSENIAGNWKNSKIDLRENDFEIVNGELVAIPKMKDLPEMLKRQA